MTSYATNQTECRSKVLQYYFNDKEGDACGCCDICLAARRQAKNTTQNIDNEIIALLKSQPHSAREITQAIKAEPKLIAAAIERLVKDEKISTSSEGKLVIKS